MRRLPRKNGTPVLCFDLNFTNIKVLPLTRDLSCGLPSTIIWKEHMDDIAGSRTDQVIWHRPDYAYKRCFQYFGNFEAQFGLLNARFWKNSWDKS